MRDFSIRFFFFWETETWYPNLIKFILMNFSFGWSIGTERDMSHKIRCRPEMIAVCLSDARVYLPSFHSSDDSHVKSPCTLFRWWYFIIVIIIPLLHCSYTKHKHIVHEAFLVGLLQRIIVVCVCGDILEPVHVFVFIFSLNIFTACVCCVYVLPLLFAMTLLILCMWTVWCGSDRKSTHSHVALHHVH